METTITKLKESITKHRKEQDIFSPLVNQVLSFFIVIIRRKIQAY